MSFPGEPLSLRVEHSPLALLLRWNGRDALQTPGTHAHPGSDAHPYGRGTALQEDERPATAGQF